MVLERVRPFFEYLFEHKDSRETLQLVVAGYPIKLLISVGYNFSVTYFKIFKTSVHSEVCLVSILFVIK